MCSEGQDAFKSFASRAVSRLRNAANSQVSARHIRTRHGLTLAASRPRAQLTFPATMDLGSRDIQNLPVPTHTREDPRHEEESEEGFLPISSPPETPPAATIDRLRLLSRMLPLDPLSSRKISIMRASDFDLMPFGAELLFKLSFISYRIVASDTAASNMENREG